MGIVNCTPDSFSDGGDYNATNSAVAHARSLIAESADILDIGGESTRPGADYIPADEEWDRVGNIIETLAKEDTVPISIDTYKAEIAGKAMSVGASIINDVSGLADPDMVNVLKEHNPIYVLMYQRDAELDTFDVRPDMIDFFNEKIGLLDREGVDLSRVWIDPGIGFHKTAEQNHILLAGLECLSVFENDILVGASRKRFIGALTGKEPKDRLAGTLAAHLKSVQKGAKIIRAHDVAPHVDAIKVMWALEKCGVD